MLQELSDFIMVFSILIILAEILYVSFCFYRCTCGRRVYLLLEGKKKCKCGMLFLLEDGYATKIQEKPEPKIRINYMKILIKIIFIGFSLKLLWWIFGTNILTIINYFK